MGGIKISKMLPEKVSWSIRWLKFPLIVLKAKLSPKSVCLHFCIWPTKVPAAPSSLYIRPSLLGTEGTLGLGPSSQVFTEISTQQLDPSLFFNLSKVLKFAPLPPISPSWTSIQLNSFLCFPGSAHSSPLPSMLVLHIRCQSIKTKTRFYCLFFLVKHESWMSGSAGLFACRSSTCALFPWRLRWHQDGKQLCSNTQGATGGFIVLVFFGGLWGRLQWFFRRQWSRAVTRFFGFMEEIIRSLRWKSLAFILALIVISQVGSMNIFMAMQSDCGTTKLVTPSLQCGTVGCYQLHVKCHNVHHRHHHHHHHLHHHHHHHQHHY